MLLKPTSKNTTIEIKVVMTTQLQVINCEPFTPIFLPKKPDVKAPKKGKIKIERYIMWRSHCFAVKYFLLTDNKLQEYLNQLLTLHQLLL